MERDSPLLASPQGGVAASPKNLAQRPKQTQPGWFSFCAHRKTTPAARSADASRHLLIAQPRLLAVVQGGDYGADSNLFTTSPSALSKVASHRFLDAEPPLLSQEGNTFCKL